jgi:hypothetical protein
MPCGFGRVTRSVLPEFRLLSTTIQPAPGAFIRTHCVVIAPQKAVVNAQKALPHQQSRLASRAWRAEPGGPLADEGRSETDQVPLFPSRVAKQIEPTGFFAQLGE